MWTRTPHIHLKVACRGYRELITQMYVADYELSDTDRVLLERPESVRAKVVVKLQDNEAGEEPGTRPCRFDIALQTARAGGRGSPILSGGLRQ